MTENPDLRAGDSDRDATTTVLREAFAQGRLTDEEYRQRLDAAHRAVTFGDLEALTRDLPAGTAAAAPPPPTVAPTPPPAPPAPAPVGGGRRRSLAAGWAAWAGVSLMMVVIWFGTVLTNDDGSRPSFWPIWVIGPWGVAMVIASFAGSDDR